MTIKIMNRLAFLLGFLAIAGQSQAATLVCPTANNLVIQNVSIDTKEVAMLHIFSDLYEIKLSSNGDCEGKSDLGFLCFQDGQFMLNISKDLEQAAVAVWLNMDTDDITLGQGKGTRHLCHAR